MMNDYMRIFIAATIGVVVGGVIEPKITPKLPASLAQSKWAGLAIHAAIGGASATGVYYAIRKVG